MEAPRRHPLAGHRPSPSHGRGPALLSLVLGALFVLGTPVMAQVCDDDKVAKRTNSGDGYSERDDGTCEGTYGRNVSGDVLTLVGLTDRYRLEGYDPVEIGWNAPEGAEVHLRVESWDAQGYQLDARNGDGQLSWTPRIPRSEAIPLERLGFLGWVPSEGPRLLVPVTVQQADSGARDRYMVHVLPNARLEAVAVTLGRVSELGDTNPADPVRSERPLNQSDYRMGSTFMFTIRHRQELTEPGVYFLRLHATPEGGSPVSIDSWFYHGVSQ